MSGRIRTIKPEVLDDEDAAGFSDAAWRLWVGSWVLCDDHGNCRAGAKYLAAQIWQDSRRAYEVDGYLAELSAAGKVTVYETGAQRFMHVNGWSKHQRVDNASKPRVPVLGDVAGYPDIRHVSYQELGGRFAEVSASLGGSREIPLAGARAQSSGEDHRPPTPTPTTDQGAPASAEAGVSASLGVESETRVKTKAPRATRVPEDFRPSDSTIAKFRKDGWDCRALVEEFIDYWRGIAGSKGVKLDWEATFRNRMRDVIALGRATRWEEPEPEDDEANEPVSAEDRQAIAQRALDFDALLDRVAQDRSAP